MFNAQRSSIDAARWPRVARSPEGFLSAGRSRWARDSFIHACADAGIVVSTSGNSDTDMADGGDTAAPVIHILDDVVFDRLAHDGWLGLAESYLAGEWTCEELPTVLGTLLDSGFEGGAKGSMLRGMRAWSRKTNQPERIVGGAELPTTLLDLISGPSLASGSALFASGVSTTAQELIPNFAPGAGRGGIPAKWAVDVTRVDPPKHVARADFATAQVRGIEALLDAGRVRAGDHVLVWPSTGGEVALRAADRGAGVDVLVVTEDHATTILDRAEDAGLGGVVQVLRSDSDVPSPREFDSDYEAIFNVQRLEVLGKERMRAWLRHAEHILTADGTIVVQMAVATDTFDDTAEQAMQLVQSYIWPHAQYPTLDAVRKIVDRDTGMRIVAETHFSGHFSETLQLNRDFFTACARKAAGLGYDVVYRKLWDFYLALQQALVDTGRLDMVRLEIVKVSERKL